MRRPRPSRRVRLLTVSVVGAALLAACVPVAPPPPPVPPYQTQYCSGGTSVRAADFQAQHDGIRTVNTDFAAGDHGVPIDLGGGRILWLFADTWVGYIRNNAMVAPYLNVHSSFIEQTGGCLRPMFGGTHGARTAVIPAGGGQYYWPMSGYVEGSTFYLFTARLGPGTVLCGCVFIDNQVLRYSLPGFVLLDSRPTPPSSRLPEFGTAIVSDASFHYFYGRNSSDGLHPQQQFVGRVPVGADPGLGASWQYWNGGTSGTAADWGTSDGAVACGSGGPCPMSFVMPNVAGPTTDGPNAGIYVIPAPGGGFLLSAKLRDVYPDPIYTWRAPTPVGPWTNPAFAANTPTISPDVFTYGGRVFQTPGGEPTVAYNTDGPRTDLHTDYYRIIFSTPAACSVAIVPCS